MSKLGKAVQTLRDRRSLTAEHRRLALGVAADTPEAEEVFQALCLQNPSIVMSGFRFEFDRRGGLLANPVNEESDEDFLDNWDEKHRRACADSFTPGQQRRALALLFKSI